MSPSSSIPAWVDILAQRFKIQRQSMSGLAKPDPENATQPATGSPAVIHYEGWHGIPSRCHVIHRRHGNRILFAFGAIEDGGTSPTNMIEELAVTTWKRFYRKARFDRIEWFDAWPEHCSLTYRFHIQRVHFRQNEADDAPRWGRISADVPEDFVAEVGRVINARSDATTVAVTVNDLDGQQQPALPVQVGSPEPDQYAAGSGVGPSSGESIRRLLSDNPPRLMPSRKENQMLTAHEVITKLELHGTTVRDRCAELFIRSEFDRLLSLVMPEIFVSRLVLIQRKEVSEREDHMGDRVVFAEKTLRDCHTEWFLEESDRDQDGIFFFQSLLRSTPADIQFCMSPDVAAFWASQDLLENGGFMQYLTPFMEIVRCLLDETNDRAGAPGQA